MMKKISIGFLGLLLATSLGAVAVKAESTKRPEKTFDVACVQSAIDKRETALEGVVDTTAASLKAALETRKTDLKTAWAIATATDRQVARKSAWDAYKTAAKSAKQTAATSRKTIVATFKTDMKACGTAVSVVATSEATAISAEQ